MVGNRAALTGASVFTGEPQPVEIHHRGIWYSGELLGWRHDDDGRAVARVRCVVDGLRHSTWKDLGELRLPDPRHPPRAEAFPAAPALPADPSGRPEDDDSTRPHVLMAAMRNRPSKPAHARIPPTEPAEPNRAAPIRPAAQPVERIPAPASYNEVRSDRRDLLPDCEPAALTGV